MLGINDHFLVYYLTIGQVEHFHGSQRGKKSLESERNLRVFNRLYTVLNGNSLGTPNSSLLNMFVPEESDRVSILVDFYSKRQTGWGMFMVPTAREKSSAMFSCLFASKFRWRPGR